MADPVGGVGGTNAEDVRSIVEKGAASILGQVMMDIVSEITKDMDSEQ